ncbi:hypothetical protein HDU83_006661 [Entophlyctis luteolus]|nr:hypothetical protein HDU83_006661 [Entophlyctis luteolus]KAJ3391697.1 hypothetical protein HDU84_005459 [Entophlyctis sp. JEL0112]
MKKRLRIRSKSPDDSDNDSTDAATAPAVPQVSVSDVLELRKLKRRATGVDAAALARGDPVLIKQREQEERARRVAAAQAEDPWKLSSGGGLVDLDVVKGSRSSAFASASNTMDTEKKMIEYIETELEKRRHRGNINSDNSSDHPSQGNDNEGGIEDSNNLLDLVSKPLEEGSVSFSAAMLTSIPLVDLGIDAKLKNIEETERAKRELMQKKEHGVQTDKLTGSMNVTASDRYFRGSRQNDHNKGHRGRNAEGNPEEKRNVSKPKFDKRTMATDEFVMDKFKKRNYPGRR